MVKHIVFWKMRPEMSTAERDPALAKIKAGFEALKGVIKPWECKVFGTACTPEHALGTCMVSPEGACAAYYNYGRFASERAVV